MARQTKPSTTVGGFTLERDSMCDNRPDRFCREPERRHITGIPCSTWRELQAKGLVPEPYRLTPNTVAWSFNELTAWVEAQKAKRTDTWQPLGQTVKLVIEKAR